MATPLSAEAQYFPPDELAGALGANVTGGHTGDA